MSFYKEVPGLQTTLESTLKFDTEPKAGSTNPVTSDGVKVAIDGAVGDAAEAIQQQIDDIAEKAGSGYTPKGEATVATLNALSGQENGELYTMTDAGTLTEGSLAVVVGDTVAWDATNSVWYKAMDYAPRQYGTNEVHNLPAITAFRTGDVIPVDGDTPANIPANLIAMKSEQDELDYELNGVDEEKTASTAAIEVFASIKEGDTFELKVSSPKDIKTFSIYAFYGSGPSDYDQLTGVLENTSRTYVAAKNYRKIRFYNSSLDYEVTCSVKVEGLADKFTLLSQDVNEVEMVANGETKTATTSNAAIDYPTSIKAGDIFGFTIDTSHSGGRFSIYAFYGSGSGDYDQLGSVNDNSSRFFIARKDYIKMRLYEVRDYTATCSLIVSGLKQSATGLNVVKPLNILVIGDSYTANANHWRKGCLAELPEGSTITSLAVIGATIKDGSNDRATYPYTSRPVSTNNNTNKNTFACQVEKLKRLMDGSDLDEGEVKLYANNTYPDVIVVAGGQNDSPDASMDNYISQFVEKKVNVYYKTDSSSAMQQGDCYAASDVDLVDRTIFAGAYRYICETLKKLFPKSVLMITTRSNLTYWKGHNIVSESERMGEQQKWCASACGASLVDWRKCQISTLTTYPAGNGTSENPYILSNNGQTYSDSNDGMHPNDRGNAKLGAFMASEIKKNFFNIIY